MWVSNLSKRAHSFWRLWMGRIRVVERDRLGLWVAALLTGLMGMVNLLSAVTPSLPERAHWLREIIPFAIRRDGYLFAAISGFLLLALAANLLRRKRVAWLLTVVLLIGSIVSHLVKGLDVEETLLASGLLTHLLLIRQAFTAQSDRPSIAQGLRAVLGALLFTLAYGTLGFYLLDTHYSINFSFWESMAQTVAMFFTEDNAGLQPTTRFGRYFADSIYIIGILTSIYAAFMLLRPVLTRQSGSSAERQKATAIVENYGQSSLARMTLLEDKTYYFSPSGQSVIAYVAKGRGAIALGDPIGPQADVNAAIVGFQQFCARNDWYPAFYQTLPDHVNLYESLGFRVVKIGEEAIVDLTDFSLEGKAGRRLRPALNKMTKLGYRVAFHSPPIPANLLQELRQVSDEWLRAVQGSEKRFSLGWFHDSYMGSCEITAIYSPDGELIAFANTVPEYQRNEITIDLMRYRPNLENGIMDFLFISLFQHCKERGYAGFNLGLSALAGVGEKVDSRRLEKGMHYLYAHLGRFYNFQGLHQYKDKFHPHWESRYLVYPSLPALPDVVMGLVRADSGDRLLDYFRPDS
jgi:phosphatidylglycerol lysyltransferase